MAAGGFLVIATAITLSVMRAREASDIDTYGSARWAGKKEIEEAGRLGPDGVVLGRYERDYLRHDGPEHILCFAPTRSGKGVGLVVPTLLTWPGSAIVHDIKGENWNLTSGFRGKHGRVLLFDPTNAASAAYNPRFTERVLPPPDPRKVTPSAGSDGWSGSAPQQPDAALLAAFEEAERKRQDRANSSLRREPELPQHVEIVHEKKAPASEPELAMLEDTADERIRQAQILRSRMRGAAGVDGPRRRHPHVTRRSHAYPDERLFPARHDAGDLRPCRQEEGLAILGDRSGRGFFPVTR